MDPDETMTTSTSSTPSALQDLIDEGYEDDNLFPDPSMDIPSNVRPRTPENDHLNAAAPGELSPPRSQPPPEASSQQQSMSTSHPIPNGGPTAANTSATRSSARIAATGPKLEGPRDDANAFPTPSEHERPGWGWKNKKVQEEMQRAWDGVVDRDFSLKEFGDVVLQGKAQIDQGR
jgi:hypothetical protein